MKLVLFLTAAQSSWHHSRQCAIRIFGRLSNMASGHLAEVVRWDCAIQCLYKMLLCSACLPLAAAVLLGSLPLLFFAPWGILYMALVTWPNKLSRESDRSLRAGRKPRISRRQSNRSLRIDGSVPIVSSTHVTDLLVNTVRPLTCSLYAVLWFA